MKSFRKALTALVALAPLAAACTTTSAPTFVEPTCRAPNSQELAIFRAVISHDRQTLINNSAQGAARSALIRNDPYINNHLWGSQGYTGGTMLGVLTQPPPCILDLPVADPTTQREIAVYQFERYNRIRPNSTVAIDAMTYRPRGVHRQDYFRCRFINTAEGWRMTDMCSMTSTGRRIG